MAELILEYLKVLLSWPLIMLILVFYLMKTQKEAITRLLDRIKQVSFPGGGFDTEYNSELPKEDTTQEVLSSPKEEKGIQVLEQDFNYFILNSLQSNFYLIMRLLGRLWKKIHYGVNPGTELQLPQKFIDRVNGLKAHLHPEAVEDLNYFIKVYTNREKTRKKIMDALVKSILIREYLEDRVAKR